MLVFKYISHLVANHFCTPDFCVDIGMRMSVNPCIDPACHDQVSVFTGKGTVQYGIFMLRSNNLQSRQVVKLRLLCVLPYFRQDFF